MQRTVDLQRAVDGERGCAAQAEAYLLCVGRAADDVGDGVFGSVDRSAFAYKLGEQAEVAGLGCEEEREVDRGCHAVAGVEEVVVGSLALQGESVVECGDLASVGQCAVPGELARAVETLDGVL